MIEREEKAQQHFEMMRTILPMAHPRRWRKELKKYVDTFIEEQVRDKEFAPIMLWEDEQELERERIRIHELRRLVAGAVQELELAQQPAHATACAKLDRALVWQGRGYVSLVMHFDCSNRFRRVNMRKFRQIYGW